LLVTLCLLGVTQYDAARLCGSERLLGSVGYAAALFLGEGRAFCVSASPSSKAS
jgi:hypothetical protein